MATTDSQTNGRGAERAILAANLLPVAGLVVFEWEVYQALFVYWVELGLTLLCYFWVVLFAQRESKPDRKRGGSYPGPISIPRGSGSVRPVSRLPPIRYQNVRYVPAALVLVLLIWFVSSRAFLDFTNPDVLMGSRGSLDEFGAAITAAYSPEGVLVAIVLFTVQFGFVSRDFFRHGLVDRYSAAMLVEIPCRIAVVWFVVLTALAPVYLLATASGTNPALTSGLIATVVVASKLAVDRSLVRIHYQDDPGTFAGLFTPNEREQEQEHQSGPDRPDNPLGGTGYEAPAIRLLGSILFFAGAVSVWSRSRTIAAGAVLVGVVAFVWAYSDYRKLREATHGERVN